jgi:hypothetical protein
MSELIHTPNTGASRNQLLLTVSALALAGCLASVTPAKAEAGRPSVWIELGGQMESINGFTRVFDPAFMSMYPVPSPEGADYKVFPDAYDPALFDRVRKSLRNTFGFEGSLAFQPQASDWVFTASARIGRSNGKHGEHEQGPTAYKYLNGRPLSLFAAEVAEAESAQTESHMLLDFQAGKDVGLGMLGRNGSSNVAVGVRFAQLSAQSTIHGIARPRMGHMMHYATFYQYQLDGEQQRSFRGIGPSVSWKASAALLGDREDTGLFLDWGLNGAVLFGRQKAHVVHHTNGVHVTHKLRAGNNPAQFVFNPVYDVDIDTARTRSVVIPNLGAFAGLSVRYSNAKVSLGYRTDFLFDAMDTGVDQRKSTTLSFHGPFATISIGLGG